MSEKKIESLIRWSQFLISIVLYAQEAIIDRKNQEWRQMMDEYIDDPQAATNHMVLGMNLEQRQLARLKEGKKVVATWVP
jgi:hypothetical protein